MNQNESQDKKDTNKGLFIIAVIVIFIGILCFRFFVATSFFVDGDSMEPTLTEGKVVWVSKLAKINRGDVIIVYCEQLDKKLIKRVVATQGDSILLVADGDKYKIQLTTAEGQTYIESYENYTPILLEREHFGCLSENVPYVVGEGFFVMGDNRNDSNDSRRMGEFLQEDVIGKVSNNNI